MEGNDAASMIFLKPGMTIGVIANCVVIKCETEDDAIIAQQILLDLAGKEIHVVSEEDSDA